MPQLPDLSRRPFAPISLAASILSLSMGCASVTSTAPANPLLSGHWQLDKSASDLVDTKVGNAIATWQAKLRQHSGYLNAGNAGNAGGGNGGRGGHRGGQGGGQGGGAQGGSGTDQSGDTSGEEFDMWRPLAPDFPEVHRRLVQVLTPPERVRFDTGTGFVRITPDNVPSRDYHTDEQFSRIDEYGTAKIDAGWSADAFELRVRYSSHATLIEHFAVDARTDTLTVTYHLNDPMVGKIDLNSVYHRG
jgi:hypothetical protein